MSNNTPIQKVCLLAAAHSIHTIKWVNALVDFMDVVLVSQHEVDDGLIDSRVKQYTLSFKGTAGYFLNVFQFKSILKQEVPDVLNVHFVSGYGTLARLANPKMPVLMNAWGSDVYTFPNRSYVHKQWLRLTLMRADRVASTSHAMKQQITSVCPNINDVLVTPFGVDMTHFVPPTEPRVSANVVVGTIKTMSDTYGIDTLIRSIYMLKQSKQYQDMQLSLVLVGGGPDTKKYQSLVTELGLDEHVTFVGQVAHEHVVKWLHRLDVYVSLSRQESFGVAIVEAQACGLPVVVSRVGGLPEVVKDGVTGFVVDADNVKQAADKIGQLVDSRELRQQMGAAGRQYVLALYEWSACVNYMISVFDETRTAYQEGHI